MSAAGGSTRTRRKFHHDIWHEIIDPRLAPGEEVSAFLRARLPADKSEKTARFVLSCANSLAVLGALIFGRGSGIDHHLWLAPVLVFAISLLFIARMRNARRSFLLALTQTRLFVLTMTSRDRVVQEREFRLGFPTEARATAWEGGCNLTITNGGETVTMGFGHLRQSVEERPATTILRALGIPRIP